MWQYIQVSGELKQDGEHAAWAYSGHGIGKNNPASQSVHNVGPIPCGLYEIGEPINTSAHGPYCLPLTPRPDNMMWGRAGFLIHGDSIQEPGTASEGCIIASKLTRIRIWESGDRLLQVVSGLKEESNGQVSA